VGGQPTVYLLLLGFAERGLFDFGGEAIPDLLHQSEAILGAEPVDSDIVARSPSMIAIVAKKVRIIGTNCFQAQTQADWPPTVSTVREPGPTARWNGRDRTHDIETASVCSPGSTVNSAVALHLTFPAR
jgi:hypothetical protein